MAFSTLAQWSATAASNTEIDGITLSNSTTPTQLDDITRELMSQVASFTAKGSDVASSGTVALGDGWFFHITGTTTITDIDFTDAKNGRFAILEFDGALTLTHNATTLNLPGGANITTAAGDRALIMQDSGDNVHVMFYQRAGGVPGTLTLGTPVASTSGTSIDFTGIPSWVKKITISFAGVSSNGTDHFLIQLGAGSAETTGYVAACTYALSDSNTNSINSTAGLILYNLGAAVTHRGALTVTLHNSSTNTWVSSGVFSESVNTLSIMCAGQKSLSGTLDRVRITTTGGANTFDAGSINIAYEG